MQAVTQTDLKQNALKVVTFSVEERNPSMSSTNLDSNLPPRHMLWRAASSLSQFRVPFDTWTKPRDIRNLFTLEGLKLCVLSRYCIMDKRFGELTVTYSSQKRQVRFPPVN